MHNAGRYGLKYTFMIIETRNQKKVALRRLDSGDIDALCRYLEQLSVDTRRRFGPHPYDKQSVTEFYQAENEHTGYVATDTETAEIVAYFIIKEGYLEQDGHRLAAYGFPPDADTDCTFAPSVADAWQSCGVGNELFRFVLEEVKASGKRRIILWAGVQGDNEKAKQFYRKQG
ncbi:MAG: GNAT family N-acetyltransferase, partial [Bacteroidetes bacterium]